eukprot:scaffold206880_cov32-Tisochrysis_lutea.AAC.1
MPGLVESRTRGMLQPKHRPEHTWMWCLGSPSPTSLLFEGLDELASPSRSSIACCCLPSRQHEMHEAKNRTIIHQPLPPIVILSRALSSRARKPLTTEEHLRRSSMDL